MTAVCPIPYAHITTSINGITLQQAFEEGFETGYNTASGIRGDSVSRVSKYVELRAEFERKVLELQQSCPHTETDFMPYEWVPGHRGHMVKVCKECGKILENIISEPNQAESEIKVLGPHVTGGTAEGLCPDCGGEFDEAGNKRYYCAHCDITWFDRGQGHLDAEAGHVT